jgi:hypothetical protein
MIIATGFPIIGPSLPATNACDYGMLLTVTEFCLLSQCAKLNVHGAQ